MFSYTNNLHHSQTQYYTSCSHGYPCYSYFNKTCCSYVHVGLPSSMMRGERVTVILPAQRHHSFLHAFREKYLPGTQMIHRSLEAKRITIDAQRPPQENQERLNHLLLCSLQGQRSLVPTRGSTSRDPRATCKGKTMVCALAEPGEGENCSTCSFRRLKGG